MSQPFVPFTAALSQSATATATAAPPTFTPATPATAAPAHALHTGEPKISFEREGDVIKLIRIQCSCGQTVELSCAY